MGAADGSPRRGAEYIGRPSGGDHITLDMSGLSFIKMHGLGNDFVVVDGRDGALALSAAAVRAIADRRTGVGCDQLIAIEPPRNGRADAYLRLYNADGEEVGACGNGSRCVAALLMAEQGSGAVVLETKAGLLQARDDGDGMIAVDMGEARTGWREIPLASELDTLKLPLAQGVLSEPAAVNIGNPHAVFFVADAEAVPLETLGPALEHDPLFPERANIGVAQVLDAGHIRLRVWERGVGLTRACGSGACAALVAAARRGLSGREATVTLDGGELSIAWRADGHVIMTGPVATSFSGTLP